MIENVSFRATTNDLQAKMKKDLQRISNSPDVIVPADKTRNLYITTVDNYEKLLHDKITKTYQHAPEGAYSQINLEAREIAERLDIAGRRYSPSPNVS